MKYLCVTDLGVLGVREKLALTILASLLGDKDCLLSFCISSKCLEHTVRSGPHCVVVCSYNANIYKTIMLKSL